MHLVQAFCYMLCQSYHGENMTETNETYWNIMVPEFTEMDFPASLAFYTDVLGFNVMIRRMEPDFAYISLWKAQLMLERYHSNRWNMVELAR